MIKRSVAVAMFVAALMTTSAAKAETAYDSEVSLTPFIYYWTYLNGGTQYTIETQNLSSSSDTVLYVIYNNGSALQQIAANDDYVTVASKVVFTAPYSDYYGVWVRAYATGSGGTADLVINGSTILTQAQFGGTVHWTTGTWDAGDQFRVAPTRFTGSEDSMIFLLRGNVDFVQMDDDNGPFVSAFAQASTSEGTGFQARAVYGLYPGATTPSYGRLFVQRPPTGSNDSDADGLTNDLETLVGTSSGNADSDNDAIPDGIETIGGNDSWSWTFSRSATAPFGNNPTRPNAYVEMGYMWNSDPSLSRVPYSSLLTDSAEIFGTDGGTDLTVVMGAPVPWHENIGLDGCGMSIPDCVDFRTQKASSFSISYPERAPYFHYSIFGYKYDDGCSSGLAEILGNDSVVTLGCWSFTQGQQRGTFVHEFGHNLALTHFDNGNNNGNNSTLHNSVMNYRYQIGGTSPSGRHTYSFGGGGCASCATSPKQACIDLNNLGQCGSPAGATCDCDLTEWGSAVNYDMTEGGNLNDGAGYTPTISAPPAVAEPINLYRPSRLAAAIDKAPDVPVSAADLASAIAEDLKKLVPQNPSARAALVQAKLDQADVSHNLAARAAAAPKPNLQRRQASVVRRVAALRSKGLVEGVDFRVSSNRSSIFMP